MCPIKIRLSEVGDNPELIAQGGVQGEFLVIAEERLISARRKVRGLGDAVAIVAKPIAKAIDAVLGTELQSCGGCGQRQEALNEMVPFGRQDAGAPGLKK